MWLLCTMVWLVGVCRPTRASKQKIIRLEFKEVGDRWTCSAAGAGGKVVTTTLPKAFCCIYGTVVRHVSNALNYHVQRTKHPRPPGVFRSSWCPGALLRQRKPLPHLSLNKQISQIFLVVCFWLVCFLPCFILR